MLTCPVPSVLKEGFSGEVVLLDPLRSESSDDLGFGSDGGMVGAGHPAGVEALLTGTAYEDVLDTIVEHVPHVQHARDVGWWDDDGISGTMVRGGMEELTP